MNLFDKADRNTPELEITASHGRDASATDGRNKSKGRKKVAREKGIISDYPNLI